MISKITGYAMSPEEIPWLHDVFMTVQDDFDERKTSYILQFLWRDLTSSFDVIGPYLHVQVNDRACTMYFWKIHLAVTDH